MEPHASFAWALHLFPPLLAPTSLFGFCYTCLLPALSDAPGHARHQFRQHVGVMSLIADSDPALKHALEYLRWALE